MLLLKVAGGAVAVVLGVVAWARFVASVDDRAWRRNDDDLW